MEALESTHFGKFLQRKPMASGQPHLDEPLMAAILLGHPLCTGFPYSSNRCKKSQIQGFRIFFDGN
jgi:hypothetical protein